MGFVQEIERMSELQDFTIRVFNYFNGKINPNIPAFLNIVIDPYEPNIAHCSTNLVNINLFKFILDNDNAILYAKDDIINIIIHELYHVSHFHNNENILNGNLFPKMQHEKDVEYMTLNYIFDNFREIYNNLGFMVNIQRVISDLSVFENYGEYIIPNFKPATLEEYYVDFITLFTMIQDLKYSEILELLQGSPDYYIVFNNIEILIKQNGIYLQPDTRLCELFKISNIIAKPGGGKNIKSYLRRFEDSKFILDITLCIDDIFTSNYIDTLNISTLSRFGHYLTFNNQPRKQWYK